MEYDDYAAYVRYESAQDLLTQLIAHVTANRTGIPNAQAEIDELAQMKNRFGPDPDSVEGAIEVLTQKAESLGYMREEQ